MFKLMSLSLAGLAAVSILPAFEIGAARPDPASQIAAVSGGVLHSSLRQHIEPTQAPAEVISAPMISPAGDEPAGCGFSYEEQVAVGVGDVYYYPVDFETEEDANEWMDVEQNQELLERLWLEELTQHLPCGLCWDLVPCRKWCWYTEGAFGIGASQFLPAGTWRVRIECTAPAKILVTCMPCPF